MPLLFRIWMLQVLSLLQVWCHIVLLSASHIVRAKKLEVGTWVSHICCLRSIQPKNSFSITVCVEWESKFPNPRQRICGTGKSPVKITISWFFRKLNVNSFFRYSRMSWSAVDEQHTLQTSRERNFPIRNFWEDFSFGVSVLWYILIYHIVLTCSFS